MFKKGLALILATLLCFVAFPAFAAPGGGGNNHDAFYEAVSRLVSSRWDESYFGEATLSVGGDTLTVDGRSIRLAGRAEASGGDVLIPAEVFEALGAPVSFDAQGVSVSKNGANVEITFGEKSVKVNGNKKGMPAAAALRNGKPVLPAAVLGDLGLGYEVVVADAGEIIITNTYQMARLVAKVTPGTTIPSLPEALETVAGPDGLYVIQFALPSQAKAACEILSALPDTLFAEPDLYVTLIDNADVAGPDAAGADDDGDVVVYADAVTQATPDAPSAGAAAGIAPAATYTHLGWGPGRMGADVYMDYLIAAGKQNASVTVAVLDTGLDTGHPYFAGRHIPGNNFITTGAPPTDVHSHGTHVSGTIVDVTIALPNVKIMPVKVLGDSGSGASTGVANGIRWAADNGANVINMSLGGGHSQIEDDAVNYAVGKNVTVVVAAGNETDDAKNHCPAHIDAAITVSAFDSANKPASFTNYGPCVDVAASGVSIVSTVPGGGTGSKSGTSMASPHVAGAAALLLCDNPSLPPASVKSLLRNFVDPITATGYYYGSGIVNIGKAAGAGAPQFITASPGGITENIYSGPITRQLAIQYYNNGSMTNVTAQATYQTGNAAVATVSAAGLVTVLGVGQTSITVGYGGVSTKVVVIGESAPPLAVQSTVPANGSYNVSVGTGTIEVYFNHRILDALSFTLRDAAGRSISWISQSLSSTGRVTIALSGALSANTEYTFTIPAGGARCAYGSLAQAFTMKFSTGDPPGPPPTAISLSPTEAAIIIGATQQLTATLTPSNASGALTWTSSNTTVATVSATGLVTARAAGVATITATTINGLTATCAVTVPDTVAPVITLTGGATMTLNRGNAYVEPGYKATDNVDGDITHKVTVSGSVDTDVVGTYKLTYTATDAAGNTGSATRTVNVVPNQASFSFSDKGKAGASFSHGFSLSFYGIATITAPGLDNKTTLTVSIKDAGGTVVFSSAFPSNGAKTVSLAPGSYTAVTQITQTNGNSTVQVSISIVEGEAPPPPPPPVLLPVITTDGLPDGKAGVAYSFLLTGADGAEPYAWTATGLPGGLALSTGGLLAGTPTEAGIYTVHITLTDAEAASVSGDFALTVAPADAPAPTPPTVTLVGSAQIVLHLGGSPYVEQGVVAVDALDGDISDSAVITGVVDTTAAGNYTLLYTVTNSAGLSASVSRRVEIVAEQTRELPGKSYSFNPKGKQGESFTYSADVPVDGLVSLSVSVANKTTITVTVTDAAGAAVFSESFSANATRSFPTEAGQHTVGVSIDQANGNTNNSLTLAAPGGTETSFPKPEIPM